MRVSAIALTVALELLQPSHIKAFCSNWIYLNQKHVIQTPSIAFARISPRIPQLSSKVLNLATAKGGTEADSVPSVLRRLPDSAVEIVLTATAAATKSSYDRAANELSRAITIPGFRKGSKLPEQVLKNALTQKTGNPHAIETQALNYLLDTMVEFAIKEEHKLTPIGQPVLSVKLEELAQKLKPGQELQIALTCDVFPDMKWKEEYASLPKPYYGLTGTYKRKPFNQERYNAALLDLRDKNALLSPLEDDTVALAWGDACVVNMVGFMANADGSKGDPLPNAASGDNVDVILGEGRYMKGLVEGLIGGRVGETRTCHVTFPERLKDKTLAGKSAVFDVEIVSGSHRLLPEVNDEFATTVKPGLTAETLQSELRKAVDEEDAKLFVDERNKALASSLADRVDVEIPDTVITQQAREKYAVMMADFRTQGMSDEDLKKMITPENFLKYKNLSKDEIAVDFRVGLAVDAIAEAEGIQVDSSIIEEQLVALQRQAEKDGQEYKPEDYRGKVEATLRRKSVLDFLAEHANLTVEYISDANEGEFDETLMQELAEETLERERKAAEETAVAEKSGETM